MRSLPWSIVAGGCHQVCPVQWSRWRAWSGRRRLNGRRLNKIVEGWISRSERDIRYISFLATPPNHWPSHLRQAPCCSPYVSLKRRLRQPGLVSEIECVFLGLSLCQSSSSYRTSPEEWASTRRIRHSSRDKRRNDVFIHSSRGPERRQIRVCGSPRRMTSRV